MFVFIACHKIKEFSCQKVSTRFLVMGDSATSRNNPNIVEVIEKNLGVAPFGVTGCHWPK